VQCPHCNGEFVFVPGWKYCSFCGRTIFSDDSEEASVAQREDATAWEAGDSSPVDFNAHPCSWEDPQVIGFFRPLFATIRDASLRPKRFFSELSVKGGFGLPILYAVIMHMAAVTARVTGSALFGVSGAAGALAGNPTAGTAAAMPLLTSLGLVTWALLIHGALVALKGRKRALGGTLRVVCYSATPDLIGVVPVLGEIVGLVWKAYLTVLGVMAVHRVGAFKALAAMALPISVAAAAVIAVLLFGLAAALS
jgi:hypothetical protein